MKVLLVNGSPHQKGCTFTALSEIASALEKNNIEAEILQLGVKPISGCMGCNKCLETGKCVINDKVNTVIKNAKNIDGYIFGSPVHYASASGAMTSFMDRLFYAGEKKLAYKPATAVVSCRRSGSTASLDQLNKYFTFNNMPVVSSQYWNIVHGGTPDDVRQDAEGMQTMRALGNNMAWVLKCIEAGKQAGINTPELEQRIYTNFIK